MSCCKKTDMALLNGSQQECQDILDSVQDSTALDYDSYSPRLSLKEEVPQVDSKKPICHNRKTFKLKNKGRSPIWGSLPFCSNENANDDQSMGVKVGGCDGEMNIGAVNSAGITIVGSSLRDLMRRKRYRQGKPVNVEIYHDVNCKVTPYKESNKTIISSPRKKVFSTKFSLPSFLKQVKKLTDSQKNSIERAGFGNLLRIPDHVLRRSQLIQLMDKWSCEKQAFIFPPGELKITLLDVSLILGLRVIGQPVVLKEGAPLTSLERELGASVLNRMINVELLKERLESIGEKDDESFIWVFLLYCFGTLLFPSANGKVDSRYLNLLQDVDCVSSFAWGAAVLEDLHNCLSQRISKKTSNIGGCLILLQIWCYEHIIIGRPKLLDYPSIFPRVCRWESSARHYSMSSQFNINFEELEHNQILWKLEPTSEEVEIDMIREIPQEWRLKTRLGTIEQPIKVPCESAVRMVKVHREVVVEEEDEDPMRLEKSTIFVLSDDEESKMNEDLKKEILELKVIIEEIKENEGKKRVENEDEIKELRKKVEDNEEQRMRVQDENEELRKWVQDEKELRKRVQGENEKLRVRVQNESEELRKRIQDVEELRDRVQYEEELRKGVQNENEKLRKRVQDEEELRKRVQDEYEKQRMRAEIENEELRKRVEDENELRKIVRDENEKLRKRIKDEEELIKRVQDEEELRKKVQDENEKRRRRVQNENDELRKRIQDEEELKKKFRYEEELRKRVEDEIEQLRKRAQDENELRKRVQTENEELRKRVQDEVEARKGVEDENDELRKIVEDEQELRKIVKDEQELRKIVEVENEKLHAENTLMEGCILDLERLLSKDSVDL
ncbi:hypothetical protein R6Q59_033153 [Mikania micrantha]